MNPESPFSSSATPGGEVVVPVSALNRAISTMLERSFPLVWVAGEVSNFTRAASGHWYFSIKDAQAQMRHSRASTTLDIYQQFVPESQRRAVDQLAGLPQSRMVH